MDGLLDGVMGRQDKESWVGGSEWCAGLGRAFPLVTWQNGVPPHNSWGVNRLVHPLAPAALRSHVLPSLVSSFPCTSWLSLPAEWSLLSQPQSPICTMEMTRGPSTWGCAEADADLSRAVWPWVGA